MVHLKEWKKGRPGRPPLVEDEIGNRGAWDETLRGGAAGTTAAPWGTVRARAPCARAESNGVLGAGMDGRCGAACSSTPRARSIERNKMNTPGGDRQPGDACGSSAQNFQASTWTTCESRR
jgi:hypothetical protein